MNWIRNFEHTERAILGAALAALLVFSYLLYDDSLLFGQAETSHLQEVGSITRIDNDVRRKNQTNFTWLPASNSQVVFQNDSIFTGDRSQAVITLADGTNLTIEPNSLITINLNDGQMSLDLKYGQLESDLAQSQLILLSNGQEYKLSNPQPQKSKVQLTKNYSGHVDVKVASGKAQIQSQQDLQPKVVTPEAPATLLKTGQTTESAKTEITLSAPRDTELTSLSPVAFSWEVTQGKVSQTQIQISKDAEFEFTLKTLRAAQSPHNFAEGLPAGSYFWRLSGLSENGSTVVSSASRFSVTDLGTPQLVQPAHLATLEETIEVLGPEDNLKFAPSVEWVAPEKLTDFTLQLSRTSDFARIDYQTQTKQKNWALPPLPSGTYYLRIQGHTVDQKTSSWSEATEFKLLLHAKKPEHPPAPVLVKNSIAVPKISAREPAAVATPLIAWKKVPEAKQYMVQIARDKNFKELLAKQALKQTEYSWSEFQPGQYYFRVFAQSPQNLSSPPSETGVLIIDKGELSLLPVSPKKSVGPSPTQQEFDLNWNSLPYAKSYLLEVARDDEFTNPVRTVIQANSYKLKTSEPGELKVRVVGLDNANNEVSEFSLPQSVIYSHRSPLNPPSLLEPFNNASIFLQSAAEPFIWLEWKKVPEAKMYIIEISKSPDFGKPLLKTQLSTNRFLIKDKLPLGKVYWRVKAVASDNNEESQWTPAREFTLFHQKNETFVE